MNGGHRGDGRLQGQGREGTPEGVSCLLAPGPTETQGELGSTGDDSRGRSASGHVTPPAHFTWACPHGAAGRAQFHQSSHWPTQPVLHFQIPCSISCITEGSTMYMKTSEIPQSSANIELKGATARANRGKGTESAWAGAQGPSRGKGVILSLEHVTA